MTCPQHARWREAARRYRAEHPERITASNRKWQLAHPERHRARNRRWYENNRALVNDRNRVHGWKVRYGIQMTVALYDNILARQQGLCAICGDEPQPRRRLNVDHDHTTGRVRGLLCDRCNRGLGYLGDTRDRIRRVMEYLR